MSPFLILGSGVAAIASVISFAFKVNLTPGIIEEITPFLNVDTFKVALAGIKFSSIKPSAFNLGTILDTLIATVFGVIPLTYSTT